MKIADLFATLGFKTDDKNLVKFNDKLQTAKTLLLGLKIAAIGGIASSIKFTNDTLQSVVALDNFSKRTDISTQSLEKWSIVAEKNNVSAEELTSSLENLTKVRSDVLLGKGNISAFQILGIDPTQDPIKILENLEQKVKGMDRAVAVNLISDLGLSPQFINLIGKGTDGLSALNKELVLTGKERENVLNLNKNFVELRLTLKQLRDKAIAGASKEISQITKGFIKWASVNKKDIIEGLKKVVLWTSKFTKAVGNSLELIGRFINAIINGGVVLKTFGIIVAGILTAMALASAPITVTLLGIIAVLDDIMTYFKGGDSITGNIVNAFKGFADDVKVVLEFLGNFVMDLIVNPIKGAIDSITGLGSGIKDKVSGVFEGTKNFLGFKKDVETPSQNGSPSSKIANQTNDVKIFINSNGSPQAIGKAVKTELEMNISNASLLLNNGGM